ncbi:sorting nexin-19 [Orycteropus afer afer]|uniref:Sorting nexin-19 n=1 Tax=Orycteropus afer afer TaxID=1230840 RepID=A0A8B7B3Q6_ORYAF|nr:sorting nexin-19 [Orycteropus afer afer]
MKAETVPPSQGTPAESSCSLNNLLGSRKLIAMGIVLCWLLIIHILVNVWLLFLLSALLVVLGGWLGSNAIVNITGRLHLERFIPVAVCPPSPEAERQLEQEINRTIRLIIRDFVSSWYRLVSQEPAFEEEMEAAMKGLVQELRRRMSMGDSHALAQRLLTLCGCHLQSYIQAKAATAGKPSNATEPSQLWEAYCQATAPHPAVKSPSSEVTHTRGIVDVLLRGLVPKPHLETRTGRHVVVELITCNVILPLISKLSDPDWIHLVLVGIFSKARDDPAEESEPLCPASALELPSVSTCLPLIVEVERLPERRAPSPVSAPVLLNCSEPEGPSDPTPEVVEGQEAIEGDSGGILEERKVGSNSSHFLQPNTQDPLFLCEDSELESPLSEMSKETLMLMTPGNFLSDRIRDALCALGDSQVLEPKDSEGSEGIEAEAEEDPGTETETHLLVSMLNACPEIHIDTVDKTVEQGDATSLTVLPEGPDITCLQRPSCLQKDLTNSVSSLDSSLPPVLLSSSPTSSLSSATFSFESLSSPDGPVIIQNLRITGTITAREHSGTGFHPYTLYTVKYETSFDGENTSSLQQLAYHTVNRRYREFLNLQTRLEEKPDLRKFIKNVKGPKKLFPDLPFGNMDSDRVEARKSLLESFLKQLCAIPEIANTEEMQEFLALNTDARIAFVKKPFMVSRIDKMVVSAIMDTLKTAFPRSEPQSPTEELSEAETESKPQTEGKKANKSRLRFSSGKIAPALNMTEAHEKVLYCIQEGSMESAILSLSGMESFIEKQNKLLEMQPEKVPENYSEQIPKGCVDGCLSDTAVPTSDLNNSDPETETELADTAINLLLLLLMEQWRWLCTENMQKVLNLMFGTLIQRWLEVQVDNLTCPQHWVQYLQLLQESIWPGGLLPKLPRPVRTQEQKVATKKQALQSLMGVLPDIVVEILGVNKCRLSWDLVLESLQQPLINRHLIYCLWDIILEFLDLRASVEESTTITSASDTPGSPKMIGVSSQL